MTNQPEPPTPPQVATQLLREGLWRVVTQSATYLLDMDAWTALRIPADVAAEGWNAADLRRDGEQLSLLEAPSVVIGQRLRLRLLVREDGKAQTVRETTPVRVLERLR